MKIDAYTKFVLSIIAVSLVFIAFDNSSLVRKAEALTSLSCTGEMTANVWGGIEATLGGYRVYVTCN